MNSPPVLRLRYTQRGVSLVELMIAMMLGLFLMIGVIQIFVSSKATYTAQESLSRLQETGRHTTHTVSRKLRMAGYTGCGRNIEVHNNLNVDLNNPAENLVYDFTRGIFGSEATGTGPDDDVELDDPDGGWTPALPDGLDSDRVAAGSDVLLIRSMNSRTAQATGTNSAQQVGHGSQMFVRQPNDFGSGDVLIITDCEKSSIFQASNITQQDNQNRTNITFTPGGGHTPGNQPGNWGQEQLYSADAEVGRLATTVFYVGEENDIHGLYRQQLSGNIPDPVLVAEDVENMQIRYGIRNGGTVHAPLIGEYLTASQVDAANAWDDVLAIEVAILVRSEGRLADISAANRTYNLAGTTITTPADSRQRQIFRTRVALRNP